MTTPTPRTDAIALDRNDSHRHPDCSDRIVGWTDYEALRDRSREIERDLAARDAELGAMKQRAEAAERDEWKEAVLNELIVAHIYTKEHETNPLKAIRDAITWNCQVALDPAVSSDAQRLRDTYLQRAEAAERKAEEAAMELQMRRTPLNAPGDEELIRQSGIQLRHCSCSGGSGDEAHADDCPLWLDVLAARQWWRDRHVVAWSCSREAKGGNRCAQWCGHQQYCNAHTRDDIEIAAIAAKGEA